MLRCRQAVLPIRYEDVRAMIAYARGTTMSFEHQKVTVDADTA